MLVIELRTAAQKPLWDVSCVEADDYYSLGLYWYSNHSAQVRPSIRLIFYSYFVRDGVMYSGSAARSCKCWRSQVNWHLFHFRQFIKENVHIQRGVPAVFPHWLSWTFILKENYQFKVSEQRGRPIRQNYIYSYRSWFFGFIIKYFADVFFLYIRLNNDYTCQCDTASDWIIA